MLKKMNKLKTNQKVHLEYCCLTFLYRNVSFNSFLLLSVAVFGLHRMRNLPVRPDRHFFVFWCGALLNILCLIAFCLSIVRYIVFRLHSVLRTPYGSLFALTRFWYTGVAQAFSRSPVPSPLHSSALFFRLALPVFCRLVCQLQLNAWNRLNFPMVR